LQLAHKQAVYRHSAHCEIQ